MATKRRKAPSDQPLPPLLSLPDATFQSIFSFLVHIDVLQPAEFDVRAYRQRLASSLLVCRVFAATTQRLITEADAAKKVIQVVASSLPLVQNGSSVVELTIDLADKDPITTWERFFQSFPRLQRLNVHRYNSLSSTVLQNVDRILEAASTHCVHVQALSFRGFRNFQVPFDGFGNVLSEENEDRSYDVPASFKNALQKWHTHNGGLRVMSIPIPCATSFFHDLAHYCPDLTYVISNSTCASIPSELSFPKLRNWEWLRLETKSALRDFASTLKPHVISRLFKLLLNIPKVEVTKWNNDTRTGPREVSIRSTNYSARMVFQYRESPYGVHDENSHRDDPIEITSFRLSSALPRSSGSTVALEPRERIIGLQFGPEARERMNRFGFGHDPREGVNGFGFGREPRERMKGFAFGREARQRMNGFQFGVEPQEPMNGFRF